jgi:enoyl-CoA hydratase
MVDEVSRLLQLWEHDPNIGAVLLDGAGERAFCAGGDVVMLHDSGKVGDSRAENFWREEYALNELIYRYSKPYICLIDGVVMGGGVGLSVHGQHRIAGDTTFFAMPETGIGYFPDVGGTYFLPRLTWGPWGIEIGQWLGLTGARLKTADTCALGIVNGYVPSDQHGALTQALGAARLDGTQTPVLDVLSRFVKRPPQSEGFSPSLKAFGEKNVPKILAALDVDGSEWAQKQAASIRAKSPFAMAASFEAVRQGAKLDFKTAMNQELSLSMGFAKTQDFYEGIRAQLIDKDRSPKWQHDDVSHVTAGQVSRVFRQAGKPLKFLP